MFEDNLKNLGKIIAKKRREAGFSQDAFAEKCRFHRTYMGTVERGETNLTLKNLKIIANQLGMEAGQLLSLAKI